MKKPHKTSEYWAGHIKAWKRGKMTQAQYCAANGLSKSAFSKWKNKLYPKLKGARKQYKTKSKYYKYTKLSDPQVESLLRSFLRGSPVEAAARKTSISKETVYKFYNDFRLAIVDGALAYPHLFFGAGMLLLLGPPANLDWIRNLVSSYFPGFRPTGMFGKIRSRTKDNPADTSNLKANIQVLTLVLFWHSFHKWSEEEIFVFRKWGYMLFFQYIYAPEHNLKPNVWSDEIQMKLYREFGGTVVARALWDYWATKRNYDPFLPANSWTLLHSDREFRTPLNNKVWFNQMFADFKWLLKKHRIGEKRTPRSTYWDEYSPSTKATLEVERTLSEKFKVMFPD